MEMTSEKIDAPVHFCIDVVDGVAYYCKYWNSCGADWFTRTWREINYAESIFRDILKVESLESCTKEELEEIVYWLDKIDYGSRYRDALRLMKEIKNGNVSKEIIDELAYIFYERIHEEAMKRRKKEFNCIWKKQRFNPADSYGLPDVVDYIEAVEALRMAEEFGFIFWWNAELVEHKILMMKENEGVKDTDEALRLVKALREGIEDKEEAKRVADKLLEFIFYARFLGPVHAPHPPAL